MPNKLKPVFVSRVIPYLLHALASKGNTIMSSGCSEIPPDPDISGIGVRSAIYIQNLLNFVPVIWALWDGQVSSYELEPIETQSTTILIIAFSILISAMVQVQTIGISNFHANVILSLSWMNNTNTFIYFLLYVQYQSQPGPDQVEPKWSAWLEHGRKKLLSFWPAYQTKRGKILHFSTFN